ncbi:MULTISPECIES: class I SAM-dependent methyltransferase [unclassified Pseudomonas]|uniref:class I SAM-dependent methyltransferase n=1 Tax=unclassified Pseudomonas TaxID=196821 RepID=UPI0011AF196E|nr:MULTISPECIES: class I SAM-dependent methyltransferase [unclassified Pseudomonas]
MSDNQRKRNSEKQSYNVTADCSGAWQNSAANINKEKLEICGHPVMESWESFYMLELAKTASKNGGRILEVGFGLGIASRHIQSFGISEHVIIEANVDVFKTLIEFSKTAEYKVIPILGKWESVIDLLADEYFDGVLYDTYPLNEEQMHSHQFAFIHKAKRIMKSGGRLTYCNLTSWGNLRKEYTSVELFKLTQAPKIEKAGFRNYSFHIVEVNPPETCPYYNFNDVIVPCVRKD